MIPYLLLPKLILQETANLDRRSVDRIGPTAAVTVDDVVEFLVAISVHPVDEIMAVIPTLANVEPLHFPNTVADRLNQLVPL
ncbi:MAG: hypothetical protein ACLQGV_13665 [Bryobacteraceae bacterium]